MDINCIKSNIQRRLGIKELNELQTYMASHMSQPFTMLLAPTGSGKTLGFALPLLARLKKPGQGVQGLVIVPSRELALQIFEVIRPIAEGYKVSVFYGGHNMREEANSLAALPDILIATPGRLLDHIQRDQLMLDRVVTLVLDEWDKTLQLGFEGDMKKIFRHLRPAPHYVVLTSATSAIDIPPYLPVKAQPVMADFSDRGDDLTGNTGAHVDIVEVPSASIDKLQTLIDLIAAHPDESAMIFVNHRESADRVVNALKKAGIPAGLYHGALDQQQRQLALEMMTNGTTPVLVTTDLGARGLDIAGVKNVVHYHIPPTQDAWTHRNGRTGRMGADGTVYVITSEHDSILDYIAYDRSYVPDPSGCEPWHPANATLYFNAGKKDKISKGDIAGYLIQRGGLTAPEVGRISVSDRYAVAAVPATKVSEVLEAVRPHKLKNKRVLVSVVENA